MGNYDFRLQNVLDFKSSMQTQMVSKYNDAKKILEKAENVLIDYNILKKKIENEKNNLSMSGRIKDLKLYNQYINQIKFQIEEQKNHIKEAEINVELAKENLVEAAKDKKIFEKLKENEFNKYLDKEKKKEAIIVDEIVTYINSNN
ncbi:flagellar export protein FliJ [Clostridium sp. D2Q-11]|uniref:Flagellar FliJ protein n=1 Tax=Anaeromonas frigoriresistens TaxID=2683708 RepID=A0A942UYB9_9FIRM|nr:flagellar export protein FliJ [Anaeromonas frigoriresistens]MBS4539845.1 flagellar export protein FliJ [Anaeromonas frigoriresistens]